MLEKEWMPYVKVTRHLPPNILYPIHGLEVNDHATSNCYRCLQYLRDNLETIKLKKIIAMEHPGRRGIYIMLDSHHTFFLWHLLAENEELDVEALVIDESKYNYSSELQMFKAMHHDGLIPFPEIMRQALDRYRLEMFSISRNDFDIVDKALTTYHQFQQKNRTDFIQSFFNGNET